MAESTLLQSVKVMGQPITELPQDLYIPPEAMEVLLETFQGPLDLLLYLIRRQNLDILDIPIAHITKQYMQYIELMHQFQITLAAEYLLMAAMLAEIKSRMLLPRPAEAEDEEVDPRAELARRLQVYEQFKSAANDLEALPRVGRDTFIVEQTACEIERQKPQAEPDLTALVAALQSVLARAQLNHHHQVTAEQLSVRERMSEVLSRLQGTDQLNFTALFRVAEGRMGVVVTFVALLELSKNSMVTLVQSQPGAPIYVKMTNQE